MEQKGFIVKDSPNENASDLPYYIMGYLCFNRVNISNFDFGK
jgi:hypothetical protein